ncbi:YjbH domain-containing protein [Thermodesulfobacteriota bacterium]
MLKSNKKKFARHIIPFSLPFIRLFSVFSVNLFSLIICTGFFISPAFSWDRPFDNPANRGGTGLVEIPNARVLEDGHLRLGYSQADPYHWYSIVFGALPGLELNAGLTEVRNVRGEFFAHRKDRAFDLKYQVVPESKKFPAIAIGLQDIFGTRLFPAEYIAVSRQLFPLDFTLGIGRNRLRGPLKLPILDQLGLFGGIEMALHEKLHFLLEYNPIEYEKDQRAVRNAVPEGASWPLNLGVSSRILPGMDLGLSYQRGEVPGFMIHLSSELGRPVLPQRPDPPAQVPAKKGPSLRENGREIIERIRDAILKTGMRRVSVFTNGEEISAEFENHYYMSNQKAVGRVLRILLFQSTQDTRKIMAVIKRRNMPLLSVSVDPDHMKKYLFGEMPKDIFYRLLNVRVTDGSAYQNDPWPIQTAEKEKRGLVLGIKPEIETFLGDQTNYVQFRVGVKPYAIVDAWEGAQVFARYDIPFYSNAVSTAEIPSDAVRSDSARYLDRNYSFDRLMLDQVMRVTERTFSRMSFGYLEKAYAGIGGEVLSFIGEGRVALGTEGDWVRKREPGTQLDLMDFDTYTLLGNLYYYLPEWNVTLNAKLGRFMYGDYGGLFQISREFNTGARVGFWFSQTDSNKFTGFNKGYNKTGFSLSIPIRMFLTHDSPQTYTYAISPWTRDVAATISHWQTLYGIASDLMPSQFKSNMEKLEE